LRAGRFPEVTQRRQGLLVAGDGGPVVAGQPLQRAQVAEEKGLLIVVAEVTVHLLGLRQGGGGGPVVPCQPLHGTQFLERKALAVRVGGVA
jgi:hypothetical protein